MAKENVKLRAPGPSGDFVYIKDGFSWPAFFFGALWALYKRAWTLFLVLALVFGGLVIFEEAIVKPSRNLLLSALMLGAYVAYAVVCGKRGNAWIRRDLSAKGYTQVE